MRKSTCMTMAAALLSGACSGPADEAEGTDALRGFRRPRVQARPCRADAFYVDVPVMVDVPWNSTTFLGGLQSHLEGLANQSGYPLFCGSDAITCPSGAVGVAVRSVLPERSGEPFRGDGHLRFFRIQFANRSTGTLSVRPSAQCDVVEEIRDWLVSNSGAAADELFVGRECGASAMGVEGAPTSEMLTWHLDRIGLSASAASVTAPPAAAQTVDLALVDSGVLSSVGTDPGGLGLASDVDLLPGEAGLHAHGTGMAILTRQVAPEARLHSLRGLAPGGSGTSEAVAAALDQVLYGASGGTRPLVVNLSLGWPTELGRASRITSPTCSSHEDPFGEPVRYLLDVARRLDDAGLRRVFVAAAAGNQPHPTPPNLFPSEPAGYPSFECTPVVAPGSPWFFPAHWERVDSCRASLPGHTRVAFGVSVVDDRDLAAANAIPDAESPLVAPGQHVYASHPNAPQTPVPTGLQCGATTPFPSAVTLPKAFSGSSVGAALVSAAAARVQAHQLADGEAPYRWNELARLLYLTGEDLCRPTPAGAPVRRLNVRRLDAALESGCAPSLVACGAALGGAEPIPPNLRDACRFELAECGLERLGFWGNLIESCSPPVSVDWPGSYASPVCSTKEGPTLFQDAASCGGACPFELEPDRKVLGPVGPQPDDPTCPDCMVYTSESKNSFHLIVELNKDLPPGTTLSNPILVFQGPHASTNAKTTYYLDLLTISDASAWVPGAFQEIAGTLDGAPGLDWSATKAALVMKVEHPDTLASKDVSPLRHVAK